MGQGLVRGDAREIPGGVACSLPCVSDDLVTAGEHRAPAFRVNAFHCLWCDVLAAQDWVQLRIGTHVETNVWRCRCTNCNKGSYWLAITSVTEVAGLCLWPQTSAAPMPHAAMPEDIKQDYEEARDIVARSSRGAAALLRLATEKLVNELQPGSANLNDKIGSLVKKGLAVEVQQALDTLRVIGNEGVHPGQIDLRDDAATAGALFNVLNFVVDQMIDQPRKRAALFNGLPQTKLAGIEERDRDVVLALEADEPDEPADGA